METPEYMFVVVKTASGEFSIGNVDGQQTTKQPSVDDIYSAVSVIKRDIEVQQTIKNLGKMFSEMVGAPAPPPPPQTTGVKPVEPTSKFKKVTRA